MKWPSGITLEEVKTICLAHAAKHSLEIEFRQTNFEGELIESIHQARLAAAGIVINPAGWTFTSVAVLDALKTFDGPKIEFRVTNVHQRNAI